MSGELMSKAEKNSENVRKARDWARYRDNKACSPVTHQEESEADLLAHLTLKLGCKV